MYDKACCGSRAGVLHTIIGFGAAWLIAGLAPALPGLTLWGLIILVVGIAGHFLWKGRMTA